MADESTTPDLVELTRRAFESANGGDYDAMVSFYAPDAVFDISLWGLGSHAGQVRIRAFLKDWIGACEQFEMEVEEILDLGNGVVFAVARQDARPAGSDVHLRLRHAAVNVWEDRVIVQSTNYRDIDEARAAAERLAEERG
jgi:ketosteroid isomerase-like protein